VTNAFYKAHAKSNVIFNLSASWWASSTGNKTVYVQVDKAGPFSRLTWGQNKYFNITGNHETISLNYVWNDTDIYDGGSWYNVYVWTPGGGVTSDVNDYLMWNILVIG
jgi:hypothetical protein